MIVVNDEQAGYAIAEAVDSSFCPGRDQVVSRHEGGELYGGVIFQWYCGASIQAQLAGFKPNWVTSDFLWASFHYPFEQLNCKVLFATTKSTNTRALRIYAKLGFSERMRTPNTFHDGSDLVMLSMAREECRWLKLSPSIRFRVAA